MENFILFFSLFGSLELFWHRWLAHSLTSIGATSESFLLTLNQFLAERRVELVSLTIHAQLIFKFPSIMFLASKNINLTIFKSVFNLRTVRLLRRPLRLDKRESFNYTLQPFLLFFFLPQVFIFELNDTFILLFQEFFGVFVVFIELLLYFIG